MTMISLLYLISQFISLLFSLWGLTLLIGLVLLYLLRFYTQLSNYPPGPLPLPIVGNIITFSRFKKHWNLEVIELSKSYGPVMTVWIGSTPFIWICDLELGKEAFNKSAFAGRPFSYFGYTYNNDNHKDIVFSNGAPWENLRKVSQVTVRNFSKTEMVPKLAERVVKESVDLIMSKEGRDKPFSIDNYAYNMFCNMLGSAVFSKHFDIEEERVKKFKYISTDFQTELGSWLYVYEFMPIVRLFAPNPLKKYYRYWSVVHRYVLDILQAHERTYDENNKRDFMDILIHSKLQAIKEEKTSAQYFDDKSITAALIELFLGGSETSHTTFKWMILFLGLYQDLQKRVREEISRELEGRMPVQKDMESMPYTMAFMSEVLRLRNPFPVGVFHMALEDSHIGQYKVTKGTSVVFHQQCIQLDEKHWNNANDFNPDRFLRPNGQYLEPKAGTYCPFSIGRRQCPGEKLAIVDLFLVLVRFLQLTNECDIALDDKYADSDVMQWPDPTIPWFQFPLPYKLVLKTRK